MGHAVSNKITTAQGLDPATMQWNDVSRHIGNILYFNILQQGFTPEAQRVDAFSKWTSADKDFVKAFSQISGAQIDRMKDVYYQKLILLLSSMDNLRGRPVLGNVSGMNLDTKIDALIQQYVSEQHNDFIDPNEIDRKLLIGYFKQYLMVKDNKSQLQAKEQLELIYRLRASNLQHFIKINDIDKNRPSLTAKYKEELGQTMI